MSKGGNKITVVFKYASKDGDDGEAKAKKDWDDFESVEEAQEWMEDKLDEFPDAIEAFKVKDEDGKELPFTVEPPRSGYTVTIGTGKATRKSTGYKPCVRGDTCKGREPLPGGKEGETRPGDAYRLKTGGLCRVDHEASKAPKPEAAKSKKK